MSKIALWFSELYQNIEGPYTVILYYLISLPADKTTSKEMWYLHF